MKDGRETRSAIPIQAALRAALRVALRVAHPSQDTPKATRSTALAAAAFPPQEVAWISVRTVCGLTVLTLRA